MASISELVDQINLYLETKGDDADLEEWVVANLQMILDSKDAALITLANGVDALFVEVGEQIIDREILRRKLADLIQAAEDPALASGENRIPTVSANDLD